MIIYSDDPRGIKQAMAEELAKDSKVQIRLKRRKAVSAQTPVLPVEAHTELTEEDADDIAKMTKAQLHEALTVKGVAFESDANKARLIELLEDN